MRRPCSGCIEAGRAHVDIIMRATGAPGYHFIDLYPAIYKGNEARPNNFRIPH
jgi:hypothetical protein